MTPTLQALLVPIKQDIVANDAAILSIRAYMGRYLPDDYEEVLHYTDGGEGQLRESVYISLWSAEDVLKLNEEKDIQKYVPGVLAIGSNGGDLYYGIDLRKDVCQYVAFDSKNMKDMYYLGSTFEEFMVRVVEGNVKEKKFEY